MTKPAVVLMLAKIYRARRASHLFLPGPRLLAQAGSFDCTQPLPLFRQGRVEQSFENFNSNRLRHEPIESCAPRIGVIFGLAISRNRDEPSEV